jgi:hypothetical protein
MKRLIIAALLLVGNGVWAQDKLPCKLENASVGRCAATVDRDGLCACAPIAAQYESKAKETIDTRSWVFQPATVSNIGYVSLALHNGPSMLIPYSGDRVVVIRDEHEKEVLSVFRDGHVEPRDNDAIDQSALRFWKILATVAPLPSCGVDADGSYWAKVTKDGKVQYVDCLTK